MILDPLMGIVGAVLVARWSVGLIRDTSGILLDCQAPEPITDAARSAVESIASTHVLDLHIWSIGPGIYSGALVVKTDDHVTPAQIREQIPEALGLVHMTIEITHD